MTLTNFPTTCFVLSLILNSANLHCPQQLLHINAPLQQSIDTLYTNFY